MTATLTEQTIGADRALVISPELVLVASCSDAATWHRVEHGACTCKGYQYRSRCRHLAVATAASHQAIPTAIPICEQCGRHATTLYGGTCARCLSSTPDD